MNSPEIYPVINETVTYLKSYNFYIVKQDENVFLIDTGINTEESWQLLLDRLANQQLSLQDIDFILLTHSHVDHIGLVNRIRQEIDIPVYAHPKAFPHLTRDEQFLKMRVNFFDKFYAEMDCRSHGKKRVKDMAEAIEKNKDQAIKGKLNPLVDGDIINGFKVISVPGHASDHLAFYEQDSGYLFSGDNLFSHINSNALIEPDQNGQLIPSLQQYENTLLTLKELHLTKVYPGHGRIIANPYDLIEKRLQYILNKAERIKDEIGDNRLTASQIARQMHGKLYDKFFSFIMSEIVGHLNRLEALGQVTYEMNNGIRYYRVIK